MPGVEALLPIGHNNDWAPPGHGMFNAAKAKQQRKASKEGGSMTSKKKHKIIQSMALKNLSAEDTDRIYDAFLVLDAAEGKESKPTGFLGYEESAMWLRAMGWVWNDQEVMERLNRGGPRQTKYSAVELLRCADAHHLERFVGKKDVFAAERKGSKKPEAPPPHATTNIDGIREQVFSILDVEGSGVIMRADLEKLLRAGEELSRVPDAEARNMQGVAADMLDHLGYPSTQLTFNIEELTEMMDKWLKIGPGLEMNELTTKT